jgi:hypothetical protein
MSYIHWDTSKRKSGLTKLVGILATDIICVMRKTPRNRGEGMGYYSDVWKTKLSLYAKAIYSVLATFVDKDGKCWPSMTTVASMAGMSRTRAKMAMTELSSTGLVSRKSRACETGAQGSNLYYLNKPPIGSNSTDGGHAVTSTRHDMPTPQARRDHPPGHDVTTNLLHNELNPMNLINDDEQAILDYLKIEIPNYSYNEKKDLMHIRALQVDFPAVNILDVLKDWRAWLIDRPLTNKSNPRSQIRTWVKNQSKWSKDKQKQPLKEQVNFLD